MSPRRLPAQALTAPALLALLLGLAACGPDTSRTLGFTRDAPDEFRVTTRAPLSMPPSLGQLPPPRPGAPRPQELSAREQGESALVAAAPGARPVAPTRGEAALLGASPGGAPADIRARVDEESLRLDRANRGLVDQVLFWREPPEPGVPVDPTREAQRLRENAALGRDASAGQTPVIQPQSRSWFDGLRLF